MAYEACDQRDVENTGTIIDAVAAAGGNYIRINNIELTVDDPVPYQKEAREKALADAQEKAQQIADSADLRLGMPTFIAESSSIILLRPISAWEYRLR